MVGCTVDRRTYFDFPAFERDNLGQLRTVSLWLPAKFAYLGTKISFLNCEHSLDGHRLEHAGKFHSVIILCVAVFHFKIRSEKSFKEDAVIVAG